MEIRKRKTRMYEPWGYVDENNYQGASIILDNDLESFFAEVSYNKDDNKIHFANKDGEEKATLDVNEFVKSDSIVEKAWYENGKIYIKFTNGDTITIDVEELIDQNEFADGLKVNEGIVSVLIDGESEAFLSVSSNGVKVSGVQDAIDIEKDRAISAETALDEKIDQEIADRKADVDEEEGRAISAETALDAKIDAETARALLVQKPHSMLRLMLKQLGQRLLRKLSMKKLTKRLQIESLMLTRKKLVQLVKRLESRENLMMKFRGQRTLNMLLT